MEVDENSPPGTPVGDPVKANDTPGEILTYTMSDTTATSGHTAMFRIDPATGQITVGPRAMLDAEATTIEYQVTVTATDPYGPPNSPVTQNVTITVNDVNEAPWVTGGPTKVKWTEDNDDSPGVANGDALPPPTYTAADQESASEDANLCDQTDDNGACAWSVEGPDATDFTIADGTTDALDFGALTFKNAPDFENPADADMDNVYMVTVKVTDNGVANKNKMSATRDVMITVTNADEDGSVTFSSVQPKVGRPFTASLTDPDDVTSTNSDGSIESGVTWEWWRTTSDSEAPFPGADEQGARAGWEKIADTKSDTYKPVSADEGRRLIAMAAYTDRRGPGNTMHMSSANRVVANTDNVAPEFKEGGDKPVMQATRYIAESADADADVVVNPDGTTNSTGDPDLDPVMATDRNDSPDSPEILTYTLGGRDKDSFEIDASSGQITVGADTKLDYESNKKTYMVTVTATDPSQAMTTIDVTINVTDVNEPPSFTTPSEGDVDKTIQENARSLNIYTFRATDPERRKVYWSLSDDATDSPNNNQFTISDRGVLSLNASPDYEDDALGSDKQYKVIVVASDDAPGAGITGEDPILTDTKTVTVTVEDVEEGGVITTTPKNPHVEDAVTASLEDGDGEPGSPTWQWTVSSGEPAGSGANSDSYTPAAEDVGKTLRVKVTYEEGNDDKMVGPISAGRVQLAPDPANVGPVFDPNAANRTVDENTGAGTRLGDAIKATDTDSLTYTVDNSDFRVNSSGQLSTAAMLNHEADDAITVVVTATDPWGDSAIVTYTVSVEDVNEAPMINTGPTRRDHLENTPIDTLISDYDATDVDDGDGDTALTWSLEGEDAAKFDLLEADGMLTFKESPNYEMPADRNKDNVYKVTVVVSDDGSPKLMDKRQVEVTVTDEEEGGTVTLSAVQPKVGINLTASLTDPDNVTSTNADGSIETGVTWQWWRTTLVTENVPEFPAATWEKIADAKSRHLQAGQW